MNILLLTDGIYPFCLGGMQKHSYNLAKYLVLNNVNVTLMHCVSSLDKTPTVEEVNSKMFLSNKNIDSICLNFPNKHKLPGHYLKNSKILSQLYFDKILDRLESYDFVYSQGFTAWHFLINKDRCPPIGVNFHGYNMFQPIFGIRPKLENILLAREVRKYAKKSDYILSLGGKLTGIIRNKLNVPMERIILSPNAIETKWLLKKEKVYNDKLRFLFVGRYDKIKAIEIIYQCIEKVNDIADFHFVGPFPEDKKLLLENVYYHGEITSESELKNIYSTSDVLLCPSFSEGMPTVILEAMASKMAIIASDVGAMKSLVTENGVLIKAADVCSLRDAILFYSKMEKSELKKHGDFSFIMLKNNFLWDTSCETTINGIKNILRN